MIRLCLFAAASLLAISFTASAQATSAPQAPKSYDEMTAEEQAIVDARASYVQGKLIAEQLRQVDPDFALLDPDELVRGMSEGLDPSADALTDLDRATLRDFNVRLRTAFSAREDARRAQLATDNAAEGAAFLADKAEADGVAVTASGLAYEVIELGEGPRPTAADTVTVQYEGTLIDGTVFDSSYERGRPASFPLSSVISGWIEGLQLMPVGSTFMFYIPPELAYGVNGTGRNIGPNATLIFKVELISID